MPGKALRTLRRLIKHYCVEACWCAWGRGKQPKSEFPKIQKINVEAQTNNWVVSHLRSVEKDEYSNEQVKTMTFVEAMFLSCPIEREQIR